MPGLIEQGAKPGTGRRFACYPPSCIFPLRFFTSMKGWLPNSLSRARRHLSFDCFLGKMARYSIVPCRRKFVCFVVGLCSGTCIGALRWGSGERDGASGNEVSFHFVLVFTLLWRCPLVVYYLLCFRRNSNSKLAKQSEGCAVQPSVELYRTAPKKF
ncbi:hypothetical protein BKA65DRAFT_494799 [Rhexocercosporidium sp. MPI-PUGE-AT-0058]|nr:hypothetical protein BKA65DRAFT_494799 [Rhexocercosporidium sp. MPI-PUGE-AT-0058]